MNVKTVGIGLGLLATILFVSDRARPKTEANNIATLKVTNSDQFKLQSDSIKLRRAEDAEILKAKNILYNSLDSLAKKAARLAKK